MKFLSYTTALLFSLVVLMVAAMAYGQAAVAIPSEGDVSGILGALFAAFGSGQWVLGAAFLVMLLTAALDKTILKNYIPTSALPWVSIGLGVIFSVLCSIAIDGITWWKAILVGLTVGPSASGLYSLVGKYFLQKKDTREVKQELKLKLPDWAR